MKEQPTTTMDHSVSIKTEDIVNTPATSNNTIDLKDKTRFTVQSEHVADATKQNNDLQEYAGSSASPNSFYSLGSSFHTAQTGPMAFSSGSDDDDSTPHPVDNYTLFPSPRVPLNQDIESQGSTESSISFTINTVDPQPNHRYENDYYDDSPLSYTQIINENTPLLINDVPPPDYDDQGVRGELPTYQQVRQEIDGDESGSNYIALLFIVLICALLMMSLFPAIFDPSDD